MWDPHQGFVNQSQETNRNRFLETTTRTCNCVQTHSFDQTGKGIDYLDPFLEREEVIVMPMSFLEQINTKL